MKKIRTLIFLGLATFLASGCTKIQMEPMPYSEVLKQGYPACGAGYYEEIFNESRYSWYYLQLAKEKGFCILNTGEYEAEDFGDYDEFKSAAMQGRFGQ